LRLLIFISGTLQRTLKRKCTVKPAEPPSPTIPVSQGRVSIERAVKAYTAEFEENSAQSPFCLRIGR
jgi:hypothetical protein